MSAEILNDIKIPGKSGGVRRQMKGGAGQHEHNTCRDTSEGLSEGYELPQVTRGMSSGSGMCFDSVAAMEGSVYERGYN